MESGRISMRRVVLAGSLLLIGLSGAGMAQNTSTFGGSGGTAFTKKCPEGQVVTVVDARFGLWLDGIRIFCQRVNFSDGSWIGTHSLAGSAGAPNSGNSAGNRDCPTGYVIKTISGGYGSYVHGVKFTCARMGSSARTTSTTKTLDLLGREGPQAGGPYSCPESKPAIGITGRAGMYVDRIGLVCGYILPATPVLLAPASGDVITRRPVFDWDDNLRINKPYRICLNLSSGAGCSISGTVRADVDESKWTPATDLPFTRGDLVYWRVEACNDNGCRHASRSFRFMP